MTPFEDTYFSNPNSMKTKCDLADSLNLVTSSISIYLPPTEAKFLNELQTRGHKVRKILPKLLKKHKKNLIYQIPISNRLRKRIQNRIEPKIRFSFRSLSSFWAEVMILANAFGISCGILLKELIAMEMDLNWKKIIRKSKIDAITTTYFSFQIKLNPHTQILTKISRI